jgi:single-stranded DNA-binding protein
MLTLLASGNIGADAEFSTTPKGKQVTSFRLGTKNRQGQTEWLRCQVWGERAQNLHPYLKKGTYLVITGSPEVYAWRNEAGDIKTLITVHVNDLDFGSAVGGPKRKKPELTEPEEDIATGETADLDKTVAA